MAGPFATTTIEDGAGGFAPAAHIYDPGNRLYGSVGLQTNGTFNPIVTGAANLEVKSLQAGVGHVAPPSVPASTTPLTNPFWRDATVYVTGGAVSAIAVDGTATGLAATGVPVTVPSNKTITLTYSVAPSWDWVLL